MLTPSLYKFFEQDGQTTSRLHLLSEKIVDSQVSSSFRIVLKFGVKNQSIFLQILNDTVRELFNNYPEDSLFLEQLIAALNNSNEFNKHRCTHDAPFDKNEINLIKCLQKIVRRDDDITTVIQQIYMYSYDYELPCCNIKNELVIKL